MKKFTSLIATIGIGIITMLYMAAVTPDVSKPVTLAGFFALLICLGGLGTFSFLSFMHDRVRRILWSIVLSLYGVYIVALSTLGNMAIPNIALATLVVVAVLFVIDRTRG